jgi:hypothetical protein
MREREIKKYPVTVAEEGVKKQWLQKCSVVEKKKLADRHRLNSLKASLSLPGNNGIKLIQGDALQTLKATRSLVNK